MEKAGLQEQALILLEGTRNVPERDSENLSRLGEQLARLLPESLFRSGNAPCADQAFANGYVVSGLQVSSA